MKNKEVDSLTLKAAIEQGKLPDFIKARSKQKGDKERFDSAISSMVQGKSKADQAASKPEPSGD